ncbi:winged helix DNA-binding domain-containing protein [Streptomyces sp. APSN-46.1]|uniref:winged helix DNA-binding domain-containing protein n=1 Tax=Streptomyces sp. APSN-46.1 TaxID=2929049 RepID=UPI001FB31640|nr:winged helix DNA-binding domain-containing protein [Streptomyces sp. APSN-46.1]MCJ1678703.1 winged helix DNA-binding domain-containing protein [Streptomyces sp. APSN-46.1]
MSPSLPLITAAERRHRLGRRHRLAPSARATTAAQAADAVVGLHATDAATVFLSVRARLTESSPATIERALYEDVSLVRLLSMRNTLFAVSTELAPYVDASTARGIATKERRTLLKHLAEDGQGLDADWLAQAEAAALKALDAHGASTGSQISAAVPALRQKITVGRGKKYETETGVATRVIRLLAADGRIRRERPRGSWTSSQFRWVHTEPWPALPAAEARAEIARRWLYAYGPATEADLKWWTGWTLTDVRKALAAVGPDQVLLDDGSTALVSPGDTAPEAAPGPWAALLPGLDPSAMGWADRGFHLDPAYKPGLFDYAGNIGPTVWWNGEIVGGWAQRPDGEIVWRLLGDPGRDAGQAIAAEAARLAQWVGGARITPRFRTPLERELGA